MLSEAILTCNGIWLDFGEASTPARRAPETSRYAGRAAFMASLNKYQRCYGVARTRKQPSISQVSCEPQTTSPRCSQNIQTGTVIRSKMSHSASCQAQANLVRANSKHLAKALRIIEMSSCQGLWLRIISKRDCCCGHTWFARKAARPGSPVYSLRLASETNDPVVVQAQYPRHRNIMAYAWHQPWNNTAELPQMHCMPPDPRTQAAISA